MRALVCAEIIVACMLATGCATYGELENDYGFSFAAAKSGQILNPAASANRKPVTGLSGAAAEANMQKYTETFGRAGQGAKGNVGSGDVRQ